jgi:hypothetical protein
MQEYLDRREKLDELMRNAFFSLAKAKCEKINPTLSVPKTTSAARKIMGTLPSWYIYMYTIYDILVHIYIFEYPRSTGPSTEGTNRATSQPYETY